MPDKPAENSNLSGVKGITNEEQAKLLDTIADEEVVRSYLSCTHFGDNFVSSEP